MVLTVPLGENIWLMRTPKIIAEQLQYGQLIRERNVHSALPG